MPVEPVGRQRQRIDLHPGGMQQGVANGCRRTDDGRLSQGLVAITAGGLGGFHKGAADVGHVHRGGKFIVQQVVVKDIEEAYDDSENTDYDLMMGDVYE